MTPQIKQRIEKIKNGEVPDGYKKTKIGIVPKEWKIICFKKMFTRLTRKNQENNTNILTLSAQNGLVSQEEFFNKSIASDDKANYFLVKCGDYAYNKSYSNGYPYGTIKRLEKYKKGILSPLYICFSPSCNNRCSDFYSQYFEAGLMDREIKTFAQEGARNHGLLNISVNDFFNAQLICPPLTEQQKIAEILATQDKIIELKERKIEELKKLKKYYLSKMFPKRGSNYPEVRFPGFTDPWEQRKLGDMMNVTSVKRIHQSDWTDSGVRFLRARDIVAAAKNEEPDDYLYISKEKYEEYSALSGKVDVSDLLVTGVGTIGVPYLVRNLEPLYFKDGNIIWFQNSDKIDGKFLFYSFSAEQIQGFVNESAGIGTVGTYTIESGKKTPISLPNQIEQAKVGEFFQQLDNLITLHQRELEEEKQKKKALAQLLLTGIVRV